MVRRDLILACAVGALFSNAVVAATPQGKSAATAAVPVTAAAPAPAAKAARAKFDFVPPDVAAAKLSRQGGLAIDTRPVGKFLASHVPGAVHLDDESVRRSEGGTPARLLPVGDLAALFARQGVTPTQPVVVYSDHDDPLAATMVAYALLRAGHLDVSILDGGFAAWQGSQTTTAHFADRPPLDPAEAAQAWSVTPPSDFAADLTDVRRYLDTRELSMIDARPPRLFRGEGRNWGRDGHIPGAANLDWTSLMASDNQSLLKPRADIDKLIKGLSADFVEPDDETLVYCGTGREATLLYLYLRYEAGWKRVRLFEGSWTEYQADASLPVMTGTERWVPIQSDGEITLSGQPTESVLRELAGRGVKLIVNCRTPNEMASVGFPMKSAAEGLGMKYVEIPLGGSEGYDPADVAALDETIKANAGTAHMHLHCASGGRAANLWMAYLIEKRGMPPAEVGSRLKKAGMVRESALERLLGRELEYQLKEGRDSAAGPATPPAKP
ncbi:MAG: rhodanese-like domain-containing protein [Phycisphaerales bacterium]